MCGNLLFGLDFLESFDPEACSFDSLLENFILTSTIPNANPLSQQNNLTLFDDLNIGSFKYTF
jgi:hypothetical protein